MCWRWDWTLLRAILGYPGPDHPAMVTFPQPPFIWRPRGHIQAKAARTGSPYGTPTRSCLLISWLFRTYDTTYSTSPTPKRKPSCIDQAGLGPSSERPSRQHAAHICQRRVCFVCHQKNSDTWFQQLLDFQPGNESL